VRADAAKCFGTECLYCRLLIFFDDREEGKEKREESVENQVGHFLPQRVEVDLRRAGREACRRKKKKKKGGGYGERGGPASAFPRDGGKKGGEKKKKGEEIVQPAMSILIVLP